MPKAVYSILQFRSDRNERINLGVIVKAKGRLPEFYPGDVRRVESIGGSPAFAEALLRDFHECQIHAIDSDTHLRGLSVYSGHPNLIVTPAMGILYQPDAVERVVRRLLFDGSDPPASDSVDLPKWLPHD